MQSLTREELQTRIDSLNPKQQEMLDELILSEIKAMAQTGEIKSSIWIPQPGPQKRALESEAQELFFGGMAGSSKTSLLVGVALTEQLHSIIYRRHYDDVSSIIDYAVEEIGHEDGLNRSAPQKWRRPDHRFPIGWYLHFGAASGPKAERKRMGRGYDFIGFDEVAEFPEKTYLFLSGWLRSSMHGQRLRIIGAGNPPLDAEGAWVFERYKAWLDPDYPNPAKDGEVRWYARDKDGFEHEVDDDNHVLIKDEWLLPRSRTFIRGTLKENVYIDPSYEGTLQQHAPGVRAALLHGDFTAWMRDDLWQVIPTKWVLAAQQRWHKDGCPDAKMATIGVDPARGGEDETVISPRTQNYFHQQVCVPGKDTPDGPSVAALVLQQIAEDQDPLVLVDAIGIGGAVIDALVDKCRFGGLQSAGKSSAKEKTGHYGFVTLRSAWHWKLREALDPDNGENLALPPCRQLRADLTAARYTVQSNGIKVESKEDIYKRLQRSTDRGDALVYAFAESGMEGVTAEHFGVVSDLKSSDPDWRMDR
jgi:hypothetical protein